MYPASKIIALFISSPVVELYSCASADSVRSIGGVYHRIIASIVEWRVAATLFALSNVYAIRYCVSFLSVALY